MANRDKRSYSDLLAVRYPVTTWRAGSEQLEIRLKRSTVDDIATYVLYDKTRSSCSDGGISYAAVQKGSEEGRMRVLNINDPESELRSNRRALHDQILERIEARFTGHAFALLIDAILRAQGFVTQTARPGPDGGVDILAARGPFGFDPPHMCVQVKSSKKPEDVTTLRALQGTMQTFNATQGLLVCWGGFTKALYREARPSFFHIRLWSAEEVLEALCENYHRLSDEIRAELPLERILTLS